MSQRKSLVLPFAFASALLLTLIVVAVAPETGGKPDTAAAKPTTGTTTSASKTADKNGNSDDDDDDASSYYTANNGDDDDDDSTEDDKDADPCADDEEDPDALPANSPEVTKLQQKNADQALQKQSCPSWANVLNFSGSRKEQPPWNRKSQTKRWDTYQRAYWVEDGVIKTCYEGLFHGKNSRRVKVWGCRFDLDKLIEEGFLPENVNKSPEAAAVLGKKDEEAKEKYKFLDVAIGTFKALEVQENLPDQLPAYVSKGIAACLQSGELAKYLKHLPDQMKKYLDKPAPYYPVVLSCVPILSVSVRNKALFPLPLFGQKIQKRHKHLPPCWTGTEDIKEGKADPNDIVFEWSRGNAKIFAHPKNTCKFEKTLVKTENGPSCP